MLVIKEISLIEKIGERDSEYEYELNAKEQYIIDVQKEFDFQMTIAKSVQMFRLNAINDWFNWFVKNNFNPINLNPTNEFISFFMEKKNFGKPLYLNVL